METSPGRSDMVLNGQQGRGMAKDTTTCADQEWPELREVRVLGLAGHMDRNHVVI